MRRSKSGLKLRPRTHFPWALVFGLLTVAACSSFPLSAVAQGGHPSVASLALAATASQPTPSALSPSRAQRDRSQDRFIASALTALRDRVAVTISGQTLDLDRDRDRVAAYFRNRSSDPYLQKAAVRGGHKDWGKKVVQESIYTLPPFDPVRLPRPLTWGEDPFQNRSWEWRFHSFEFVPDVITYHRASKDPKALAFLLSTVDDWLAKNAVADPPTPMSWHDQGSGLRLQQLLAIFEYARQHSLSPEQNAALLRAIYVHAEFLVNCYARHNNHGLDQALSLTLAGLALPELEKAGHWKQLGAERLLDECRFALTDEGVHVENSPSYHFIIMQRLSMIAGVMRAYGQPLAEFETLLSKAYRYAAYVSLPDGTLPLIGDTTLGRQRTKEVAPPSAAGSPEGKTLFYSLTQGKQGTRPTAADALFPHSGYVILRDRWGAPRDFDQTVFFMMKMASLSTFHEHDDILSFWLYGFGESWIVDSGLYKYAETDPLRLYMRSRRAHNVVLVDQQVSRQTPRWLRVTPSTYEDGRASDRVVYVRASFDVAPQVRQTREVLFVKPRLFLIKDTLHSLDGTSHDYLQVFHIDRRKAVRELPDGFSVASRAKQGASLLLIACPGSFSGLYKAEGQTEPYLQGWVSFESFTQSPAPVVGFRANGVNHVFRTTLELLPPEGQPTHEKAMDAETFDQTWNTALSSLPPSTPAGSP